MEKIYVGHSRDMNFQKELYEPLRKSSLNSIYDIILPHEYNEEPFDSKSAIKEIKLMIAEVSFPSTGLGIELGWANLENKPIICVCKKGSKISGSLKVVSSKFIEYENSEDLILKLKSAIEDI